MHIPDGYLSPTTCAAAAAAAAPSWLLAARRLRRRLGDREAPLLAAGAAFCFVLMMLNVPVPGGTTAHAVGGTLVAIVLGPDAAILALTVTLVIQALFFGDGGVMTLGANCLNMGAILPVSGWVVYRALCPGPAGSAGLSRSWAAGCGAYVGINLAALAAAIELGIQPMLFHTARGAALYCPYRMSQTIPAMALAHLTVAGGVEAAVTGLAVAYLLRADPGSLPDLADRPGRLAHAAWRGIALLLVLAPLGLIAPGAAFGEWSAGELKAALGYVPPGLAHLAGLWYRAPLPGYGLPGAPATGAYLAIGAWFSAVVGLLLILLMVGVVVRLGGLRRNGSRDAAARTQLRRGSAALVAQDSGPGWSEAGIPRWMENSRRPVALSLSGRTRRVSFVEKTLADVGKFMQQSVFAEEISRAPGLLQGLRPGVKLATFTAAILTAASLRDPRLLFAMLVVSALLAALSSAPAEVLGRKIGLVSAWTALLALPALFNVVNPGAPLLVLARWHPTAGLPGVLAVTQQGCFSVLVLVLRVTACVWLAALLTLTTRWGDLLAAMRSFQAPRLFVFILAMVYRYLFLLLRIAGDLFMARRSRMVRSEGVEDGRKFVGAAASFLFGKSRSLSEECYAAMVSRGYRGEPRVFSPPPPGRRDLVWCGICLLVLLALWWGDRLCG